MRSFLLISMLILAACSSEPEPARTAAEVEADRVAAREKAKQGFAGEQVKALDKAASVQDTLDASRVQRDAEIDEATDADDEPEDDDGQD